jgi:hypothetical protein
MKACTRCKQLKPLTDFYLGNRRGKDYYYSRCKACHKDLNAEYKENGRNWELNKKYGITLDEYKHQCQIRNYVCDICDTRVEVLHVDHCHETNVVRGYLCGSCNRGIGLLKDSSQVCFNASRYLQHYETSGHSRYAS